MVQTLILMELSLLSVPSGERFLEQAGPAFEAYSSGDHARALAMFHDPGERPRVAGLQRSARGAHPRLGDSVARGCRHLLRRRAARADPVGVRVPAGGRDRSARPVRFGLPDRALWLEVADCRWPGPMAPTTTSAKNVIAMRIRLALNASPIEPWSPWRSHSMCGFSRGDAHAGGADRLPHLLGQNPVGFRGSARDRRRRPRGPRSRRRSPLLAPRSTGTGSARRPLGDRRRHASLRRG
jgi:hypothetical protein